jgi:uncharacterized small protein (TIGR04563 family)
MKVKQSLYFPGKMLDEMTTQAERLERSISWIVGQAWKNARREIMSMASATPPDELTGIAERSGTGTDEL